MHRLGSVPTPLDRSTIQPFEDGEPGRFYYTRYDHTTGVEAERALGELDGGHALLFASGAAASTAATLGWGRPCCPALSSTSTRTN